MAFLGILPESPSASAQIARGLGGGLGSGLAQSVERSANLANQLKLQEARQKTDKLEEKRRGYEIGLGTIEAMKSLIPDLGTSNALLSYIPGTEASGAAQKYKTYSNSLIGILSTIPVRNQKEFESVKESLASPHASQEQIRRGIEGAEDIISRHLDSLGGEKHVEKSPGKKSKSGKVRFDPQNPEHIAKMRQLEKAHKGDKAKVNRDLAREFE
jgi:hypothetical protein